jgi:hypothetical protein
MRGRDKHLGQELDAALRSFHALKRPLPGIQDEANRESFLEQLLESIHRVEYIRLIDKRDVSQFRADASSDLFDPLKAAILHKRAGRIDEAFWMVFLSVHFGKHRKDGWRLARDIYGNLGKGRWDWSRVSANPGSFRKWLAANEDVLKDAKIRRRFGNHRKYESLDAWNPRGTGAAVETYVKWVKPPRTHMEMIREARKVGGDDPRKLFAYLYDSMDAVATFGRTAKFDYLTMIGKLQLAPIEPGSTYMNGATGPFKGSNLLFGGSIDSGLTRKDIDQSLVDMGAALKVGMQVLEDALCNWQKSPAKFKPFRG